MHPIIIPREEHRRKAIDQMRCLKWCGLALPRGLPYKLGGWSSRLCSHLAGNACEVTEVQGIVRLRGMTEVKGRPSKETAWRNIIFFDFVAGFRTGRIP